MMLTMHTMFVSVKLPFTISRMDELTMNAFVWATEEGLMMKTPQGQHAYMAQLSKWRLQGVFKP